MDPTLPTPLMGFPIVVTLPVQWGDQDAFGHVNNTIYLRWFESARIEYLLRIGLPSIMTAQRIGPILASITCDFRRPVTFPDTVRIGAKVTRIGRTSFTMEHCTVAASSSEIAADGTSALVLYDYQASRPHPVPDNIRQEIERLEGRTFP